MRSKIRDILQNEGIDLFGILSLDECKITREYLLTRSGISKGSAIIMAIPYVSEDFGVGNISEYAKPRDYHAYFKELFQRLIPRLEETFPDSTFAGFSDHSPIDERHAAALSGIGVFGKNRLLITEKYSSFIFLGEVITDLSLESDAGEIGYCSGCDVCLSKCPFDLDPSQSCLSAITQKKGELDSDEAAHIRSTGCAWGCDECQKLCPYTKRALKAGSIFTKIPFFLEERIPFLTYRAVSDMSDEEFALRPYSWRGRNTILRNLEILENDE